MRGVRVLVLLGCFALVWLVVYSATGGRRTEARARVAGTGVDREIGSRNWELGDGRWGDPPQSAINIPQSAKGRERAMKLRGLRPWQPFDRSLEEDSTRAYVRGLLLWARDGDAEAKAELERWVVAHTPVRWRRFIQPAEPVVKWPPAGMKEGPR